MLGKGGISVLQTSIFGLAIVLHDWEAEIDSDNIYI